MAFAAIVLSFAQSPTPVSSLPYFCGFEDASENANWTLNRRTGLSANVPLPSNWTISSGAKHSGIRGLYIFTTAGGANESTAQYDGSKAVMTVAERTFSIPAGTYDLAFDWRCLGDSINDAIAVYWVPASTVVSGNATGSLPTSLTPLTIAGKKYLSGSASWTQSRTTVTVSGTQSYKLLFIWHNNTTNTYNPSGCIDNVQLQVSETEADCWKSVTNLSWSQGATSDVLSWNGTAGATYTITYWLEGAIEIDTVYNVTTNRYAFSHGELMSGLYTFAVQAECDGEQSIFVECINAKSLGDYSVVAEACPEVDLKPTEVVGDVKYLTPACDNDGTYTIKPNIVAGGGSIAGYRVDPVSYSDCPFPFDLNMLPQQYRNQITTITRDDYWDTKLINLPFAVCFFDGVYRQALVGANGIVTFDPAIHPGERCEWDLKSQPDIPSTEFLYKNCIMGVYQDYDPAYMAPNGQIWYGVLGEWPCRKMVVCWNEVTMFSDHGRNSAMIVMYEGTNVIDVYVKHRGHAVWNNGIGIIGILNSDGTDGAVAPHRNTSDHDWSADNEAWRFTPYSTPAYMLTWYKGLFQSPADVDAYIEEHPDEEIELGKADSIILYDGGDVQAVTARLQYSQCNGDYIDIVDYAYINWPHMDTIVVDTFFCQGKVYRDQYVPYADTAGVYEIGIPNRQGCDSIIYQLNLTEKKKKDSERFDTICAGEELIVEGLHLTKSGDYPVAVKYERCDCDSLNQMVHLVVQDLTNFGLQPLGSVCADDEQFVIGLESELSQMIYSLTFDDKAQAQGFENIVNDTASAVSEIVITMPDSVRPDTYKVEVELLSMTCGSLDQEIEFVVSYPSSITEVKWINVIPVKSYDYNGGYNFSSFQWYKNGILMEGETEPYYHVEGELEKGAYYQVALTREGEDYAILSCPIYYGLSDIESVSAGVQENNGTEVKKVIRDGHIYIIKDNKVYTVLGTLF